MRHQCEYTLIPSSMCHIEEEINVNNTCSCCLTFISSLLNWRGSKCTSISTWRKQSPCQCITKYMRRAHKKDLFEFRRTWTSRQGMGCIIWIKRVDLSYFSSHSSQPLSVSLMALHAQKGRCGALNTDSFVLGAQCSVLSKKETSMVPSLWFPAFEFRSINKVMYGTDQFCFWAQCDRWSWVGKPQGPSIFSN